MNPNFPHIPPEVVQALNEHFPRKPIKQSDPHEALMWQGGQRSVIDYLQRVADEQYKRSILGEAAEDDAAFYIEPQE